MENLDSTMELSFNELNSSDEENHILVAKLVSHKVLNYNAMAAVITSLWNLGQNIQVTPLDRT